MATKTVILRPAFTVEIGGNPTSTPTNTLINDYYKLINEEISDDSATILTLTNEDPESKGDSFTYGFRYNNRGYISSLKLFAILSEYTNTSTIKITISVLDNNLSTLISVNKDISISDFNNSETTGIDISDIIQILNNMSNGYIYIKISGYNSYANKYGAICLTQSYIVLESAEIFYVKQKDIWSQIVPNKIYKKQNNKWIQSDIFNLQHNERYIVKFLE